LNRPNAVGLAIDDAPREAARDARRLHKALANPMATWKDGQVVWVQPEDIQVVTKDNGPEGRDPRRAAAVRWGMRVTIQLPADISAALGDHWDDVPRRSLEAIAVDAYRTGALTEAQVRRLLGLDTRFQVHALLKAHHVPLHYTSADLEDDLRT